jgi:hypothetical protein
MVTRPNPNACFRLYLAASVLVVLAQGCTDTPPERIISRQQGGQRAAIADVAAVSVNSLVSDSDAAAIVLVKSVTEPQWNSTDGRAWTAEESTRAGVLAWQFRDATLSVEQVVFSPKRLDLLTGADVTVRLFGSGKPADEPVGPARSHVRLDEISGPVAPGMRLLLLLAVGEFPTEGGLVPVVRIVGHYRGNWQLVAGDARNLESARSAKEQDLVQTLVAERQAGRAPLAPTPVDPGGRPPPGSPDRTPTTSAGGGPTDQTTTSMPPPTPPVPATPIS